MIDEEKYYYPTEEFKEVDTPFLYPSGISKYIARCSIKATNESFRDAIIYKVKRHSPSIKKDPRKTTTTTTTNIESLEESLHSFLFNKKKSSFDEDNNNNIRESLFDSTNPHLPRLLKKITSSNDDTSYYYFEYESPSQTFDGYTRSNNIISSSFLYYQLLKATQFLQSQGLNSTKYYITMSYNNLWLKIIPPPPTPIIESPIDYNESLTSRWIKSKVSNFEYLMALNTAVGRTVLDTKFHPVLPWVSDFNGNYRDLRKSKYRLTKGDSHLDLSYQNTGHHITENLSEITFYIYTARKTPIEILKSVVRSNFVSQEYPGSIKRLYDWTPDECIPEFYTDGSVFKSRNLLCDLELPNDEFISYHRGLLESEQVSRNLHYWIDLNFGVALSGKEARTNKNVTLKGFTQLFTSAHPRRRQNEEQVNVVTENSSSLENSVRLVLNNTSGMNEEEELPHKKSLSLENQLLRAVAPSSISGSESIYYFQKEFYEDRVVLKDKTFPPSYSTLYERLSEFHLERREEVQLDILIALLKTFNDQQYSKSIVLGHVMHWLSSSVIVVLAIEKLVPLVLKNNTEFLEFVYNFYENVKDDRTRLELLSIKFLYNFLKHSEDIKSFIERILISVFLNEWWLEEGKGVQHKHDVALAIRYVMSVLGQRVCTLHILPALLGKLGKTNSNLLCNVIRDYWIQDTACDKMIFYKIILPRAYAVLENEFVMRLLAQMFCQLKNSDEVFKELLKEFSTSLSAFENLVKVVALVLNTNTSSLSIELVRTVLSKYSLKGEFNKVLLSHLYDPLERLFGKRLRIERPKSVVKVCKEEDWEFIKWERAYDDNSAGGIIVPRTTLSSNAREESITYMSKFNNNECFTNGPLIMTAASSSTNSRKSNNSHHRTIGVWNNKLECTFEGAETHTRNVFSITCMSNNNNIASADQTCIKIWDLRKQVVKTSTSYDDEKQQYYGYSTCISLRHNKNILTTRQNDSDSSSVVQCLDAFDSLRVVSEWQVPNTGIIKCTCELMNNTIVLGTSSGKVMTIDTRTGQRRKQKYSILSEWSNSDNDDIIQIFPYSDSFIIIVTSVRVTVWNLRGGDSPSAVAFSSNITSATLESDNVLYTLHSNNTIISITRIPSVEALNKSTSVIQLQSKVIKSFTTFSIKSFVVLPLLELLLVGGASDNKNDNHSGMISVVEIPIESH